MPWESVDSKLSPGNADILNCKTRVRDNPHPKYAYFHRENTLIISGDIRPLLQMSRKESQEQMQQQMKATKTGKVMGDQKSVPGQC